MAHSCLSPAPNDKAAQGLHVPAARITQIRASTWEYANTTLQDVCMFRADKLAGQGKL